MPFGIGKKEKDEDGNQMTVAEQQDWETTTDDGEQPSIATEEAALDDLIEAIDENPEGPVSAEGTTSEQSEVGEDNAAEGAKDEEKDDDEDLLGDIFDEEETSNVEMQALAGGLPEVDAQELVTLAGEVASRLGIVVPA